MSLGKHIRNSINEYQRYFTSFNAFDRHKILVNQYLLYYPNSEGAFVKRDNSKDKTDFDVIRENHQFLWEDNSAVEDWGKRLARKYYDKLFKEYCICDLSRYKEGQIGMRWRTEKEVIDGRGQFGCGSKHCDVKEGIRTWEMNFGYIEHGEKKNALVKLRLCPDCSYKVNYKRKRKEVTKSRSTKRKKNEDDHQKKKKREFNEEENSTNISHLENEDQERTTESEECNSEMNIWKEPPKVSEEKDKGEEFEDYLIDLLL